MKTNKHLSITNKYIQTRTNTNKDMSTLKCCKEYSQALLKVQRTSADANKQAVTGTSRYYAGVWWRVTHPPVTSLPLLLHLSPGASLPFPPPDLLTPPSIHPSPFHTTPLTTALQNSLFNLSPPFPTQPLPNPSPPIHPFPPPNPLHLPFPPPPPRPSLGSLPGNITTWPANPSPPLPYVASTPHHLSPPTALTFFIPNLPPPSCLILHR